MNTEQPSMTPPHLSGACVEVSQWGWRHAGRKKWVLDDLSFTINPGEKVLILGASGSGKSTLIAALAGVLGGEDEGDVHGRIRIDGVSPEKQRGVVGLVMQDPEAQVVLARVGDDVAFGCENLAVPAEEIWPRVDEALAQVGTDIHPLHSTAELSGGQKQRLALASIFAMKPRLVLLDEPTANLDPDGIVQVRRSAEAILASTGATAIIIEHRVDVWADMIDRVIVLENGQISADGPLDEVLHAQGKRLRAAGIWLPGDEALVAAKIDERPLLRPTPLDSESSAGAHSDSPVVSYADGHAFEMKDLSIGYGETAIRDGINLTISQGQSTCIVGANGCGKSTLVLTLAGLLPPLKGSVNVAKALIPQGKSADPNTWSSKELLGRIALVFQEPEYQFLEKTVKAELELGLRKAEKSEDEINTLTEEYLKALRLEHLALAHPMSLSGGEKRRLSVATALINAPDILILDEPTFGQDRNSWKELVTLLKRALSRGTTIISITHDQAFIDAIADHVIALDEYGTAGAAKRKSLRDHHPSHTFSSAEASAARLNGRKGFLGKLNPVTQFLAVAIITTPVITSVDVTTGGVALLFVLLFVPLSGIRLRTFLIRLTPVFIAAPLASISMLLYGRAEGRIWWEFGPAQISDNSILLAVSIMLRIFAMAIPAIVVFPSIDPTDMSDGLTQVLKLPPRPVIASLAASRMIGLMMEDWSALQRARRTRGKGDSHGFSAFLHAAFALLVFALRRSAKLSITMEARGFGSDQPRTYARRSRLRNADYVALLVSIVIPIIYISAAIWAGTYSFFGTTR